MFTRKKQTPYDFPDDEAVFKANAEADRNILAQRIPEEYLLDPRNAEPKLDHLRAVLMEQSEKNKKENMERFSSSPSRLNKSFDALGDRSADDEEDTADSTITDILDAAEKDVNEHLARMKAVLLKDPTLLDTYSRHTDILLQEQAKKLDSMQQKREELQSKSMDILKSLSQNIYAGGDSELTESDVQQARLDSWEKALEWYIYCPPDYKNNDSSVSTILSERSILSKSIGGSGSSNNKPSLNLHQLLQHLSITCITEDDETNIAALEKANQMCEAHLATAQSLISDASENTGVNYEAYTIQLMAHSLAAQGMLKRSEQIHSQYLLHGREALKIGSSLEMAEAKRRQSDNATMLLQRWWMMENLAEQEDRSGEEIRVNEEVRGIIPSSSCRMDPLFTRPEYSLEAAKALKSMRMVVRCRSTSNRSNIASDIGGNLDPQASRRFELTDNLIQRTSTSLEQRLLNSFSEIYSNGGTYDFTSLKAAIRPGRLDWLSLREVAEALMNFDSGRSLHKKYLELVINTRFPEFFAENGIFTPPPKNFEEKDDVDVDTMRSKLSNLFHRVCEVLSEEFKLIAHVFSPTLPLHLQEGSSSESRKSVNSSSFSETYPLQVARSLLQRIISDRHDGMQAKINELMESIDQEGDSVSGAKKLDMFVLIHEKAAVLFSRLKDGAQKMWGASAPLYGETKER